MSIMNRVYITNNGNILDLRNTDILKAIKEESKTKVVATIKNDDNNVIEVIEITK